MSTASVNETGPGEASTSTGERVVRYAVGAVGVVGGVYGAYLLLSQEKLDQIVQVVEWLVIGVIVHDGVIAPLAIGLGWLMTRHLPARVLTPLAVALVVIGTTTFGAIPVLNRQGANSANYTLLDRSYNVNWLIFAGVVLVAAGVGALVMRWWNEHHGARHPEARHHEDGATPADR